MEPKGWVKAVERLGISTLYSCVAIFGLYKAAAWIAPRVDEFMRNHFETMAKLTETATKIEETQRVGTEILKEMLDESMKIHDEGQARRDLTLKIREELQGVSSDVKDIKKVIVK